MIEFAHKRRLVGSVGQGRHRSGWPFVINHISKIERDFGVLVDDFADYTFYSDKQIVHNYPWVGIFHHPLSPPSWAWEKKKYLNHLFPTSLLSLKACIVFSKYLADQLRTEYGIEASVLWHPTQLGVMPWSLDAFLANANKTAY